MDDEIDQHWWFDWTCPNCGSPRPQPIMRAEVIPAVGGASVSLAAGYDSTCVRCSYVLKAGDHITLCHDVGSETVERTAYAIPQPSFV